MTAPAREAWELVCGCSGTHIDGCILGEAEAIALAAAAATGDGRHQLIAALEGLLAAGLLVNDDIEEPVIDGLLDMLFEFGLLGRKA